MNHFKAIAAALAICVAMPASAGTVIINFEGLANGDGVNGYYSGGTSASGASAPIRGPIPTWSTVTVTSTSPAFC